jgi:hypothetical protein
MTVGALPASQTRSLSHRTARRSTTALTSPYPKIPFERRIDAKPVHALDRRASYSPLPSARLRLIAPRSHPRALPEMAKSP